jgi:uncharacterized protein (TIGR03032 family)
LDRRTALGRDLTIESDMPDQVQFEASPGFVQLLEVTACTLAVTVYLQGRVVLVSADAGQLVIHACAYERPMGLAVREENGALTMAVATFQEVAILKDEPLLAANLPGSERQYQHLLVPRAVMFSGDIDAHDMVWLGNRLYAANTRFSCISEIETGHSFLPVWQPPFVSQIVPEDRCHLNGLAATEDRIAYVTALGQSDTARGWGAGRASGGLLLKVPSGDAVLNGLSMPHSPRLFDDVLYVLESGQGRVLQVDPVQRKARQLAELPGFTRGLDCYGDILFVGLSKIRESAKIKLPIGERHENLNCGIAAVHRASGQVLGWMRFGDNYTEIFDVKVLPRFRRGGMLSVLDDGHRRALVLPGRAFWAGERPAK